MISRLHGILLEKTPPALVIDVGGVGYEVFVPMTTLYHLPEQGKPVTLHTHFVVREDAQQLYGFHTRQDRELFRTLIRVNGIGPKMALGILSGMETADLVRCVQSDNTAALTRIPGIGKKTAERLIIELRDKLGDTHAEHFAATTGGTPVVRPADARNEAESALASLGYKPADASRMVSSAAKENSSATREELIRLALRAAVKI